MKELQIELQKEFLKYLIDHKQPKGREIDWTWREFNLLAKKLAEIADNTQCQFFIRKEAELDILIQQDKKRYKD